MFGKKYSDCCLKKRFAFLFPSSLFHPFFYLFPPFFPFFYLPPHVSRHQLHHLYAWRNDLLKITHLPFSIARYAQQAQWKILLF